MAADNYSDVVQALARQIVDTCMQTLRKNVQGIIAGAVISADQIEGEISNVNTTNMVLDTDHVIGLNNYVANMIQSADIDVSQIARVGEDGKLYLDNVYINHQQVNDLEARFADIWRADINQANIQQAIIDALYTRFADIANAQIGTATINSAQIEDLQATAAAIAKAQIGQADIDYAQIKDLSANTAIIEKGLNGKLYVADLAVTEANMVSLTVGELVVKGADGGFYSVSVDPDGRVTGQKKMVNSNDIDNLAVTGDKIADSTINGDTKIIESSITARTLNVQDIFAQNAMVLKLIAQNINVDELFANEAFIDKLNTTDIASNTYLQLAIQSAKDELSDEISIRLSDNSIISTVTGSQTFSDIINERTRQTVTVMYCISDNGSEPPDAHADWSPNMPEATWGDYLWTRTVTDYGNGQPRTTFYQVTQFGEHPADGITLKITSETGFTFREPEGEIILKATVYAAGIALDQVDVMAMGCIQWFKNGVRITGAAITDWDELTIDLSTVGERAVYTAKLMG